MDASSPLPSAPPPMPAKSGGGSKWVLLGCGGCLVLIVLGALFAGGIAMFVFGVIKSTDVYQTALKRAQNSSEVQAALGTPIEAGMLVSGSVNTNNGQGTADINFSISGPKGTGTVIARASKEPGGTWMYSILQVNITGTGQVIDLRDSP